MLRVWFCLLSLLTILEAKGLKELLYQSSKNSLLEAQEYQTKALHSQKQALYAGYLPKVEIGYAYTEFKNPDIFYPKNTNGVYLEASWLLFDGLKREGKLTSADYQIQSSKFQTQATQEQIHLQIIQTYFQALSVESQINALKYQQKELEESIAKYQILVFSELTSKDTLEAIKAQFSQNAYQLESANVALRAYKERLSLLSGVEVEDLNPNTQLKSIEVYKPSSDTFALQSKFYQVKGIEATTSQYTYLPTITFYNRYTNFDYRHRNIPTLPFPLALQEPKYQNVFRIDISMTIFDTLATFRQRESSKFLALAANAEYFYQKDLQKREQVIAKNALNSAKEKIKWAKSSLDSANIAYAYAKEKFNAELIDYTQYLKSLSLLLNAESFYEESRFDYEIKKAEFLFKNGEKLSDYL